jgi:hypothetical protein
MGKGRKEEKTVFSQNNTQTTKDWATRTKHYRGLIHVITKDIKFLGH